MCAKILDLYKKTNLLLGFYLSTANTNIWSTEINIKCAIKVSFFPFGGYKTAALKLLLVKGDRFCSSDCVALNIKAFVSRRPHRAESL